MASERRDPPVGPVHLPGAVRGDSPCEARLPGDIGYLCTRPSGHDGEHIARDGRSRAVARWPQSDLGEFAEPAARRWTYCADAQPEPPGSRLYEVARRLDGRPFADVSLWDGSSFRDFGVYAWREIDLGDPPPLRPDDRTYLAAAGVPAEWLPEET